MNLPEQEYHDYDAWSYSTIAKYAKDGFSALATLHDRTAPTPAMEFGSLFDSMITKGKQTLSEYAVDDTVAPPAERAVFDKLLSEGYTKPFDQLSVPEVLAAAEACAFYPKYKDETRYEKLRAASGYYDIRRTGKKIVSAQDWEDAVAMYRVFRDDPYLKKLFGTHNTENVEYIYQGQFLTEITLPSNSTVTVKIMPDLLVINHKDKTIQPVDLKTSAMPAYSFSENFVKYRYDLQAECYTDVLHQIISKDEEYRNYSILPYLFTDISRTDKVPVTYVYDPTNGFSFAKGEKTYVYSGWKQLLDEILEYENTSAKVPSYITTEGPNDLIDILSR